MAEMITFRIADGRLLDLGAVPFPIRVDGVCDQEVALDDGWTHYGVVLRGSPLVRLAAGEFRLRPGMFFAVPRSGSVVGQGGRTLIISRCGPPGLTQIGGPLEPEGRLRYINGCSDTLLVSPPRKGDPCLNHLHVPPGVRQTAHIHPSDRIGAVVSGSARCYTLAGVVELSAGEGWFIPSGVRHAFETVEQALDVVAWHPDSDFGPSDEEHPMMNGTIIKT
jgi:quercetin dioxygenase-like cupin family protein